MPMQQPKNGCSAAAKSPRWAKGDMRIHKYLVRLVITPDCFHSQTVQKWCTKRLCFSMSMCFWCLVSGWKVGGEPCWCSKKCLLSLPLILKVNTNNSINMPSLKPWLPSQTDVVFMYVDQTNMWATNPFSVHFIYSGFGNCQGCVVCFFVWTWSRLIQSLPANEAYKVDS